MSPKIESLLKEAGTLSRADILLLARELLGMARSENPGGGYSWRLARGTVKRGSQDAQDRVSTDRTDADASREGAA